jgi:hypothetical protein
LPFLNIPTSFYEFWKFETISEIYLNKKEKEKGGMSRIRPMALAFRRGGLLRLQAVVPSQPEGAAYYPAQPGRLGQPARQARSRPDHRARCARGSAVAGG